MIAPTDLGDIRVEQLPDVLLPYQRELFAALDANKGVVSEKSRRIGVTWGVAAYAALRAGMARSAGGSDVLYIGYNLEMTREFVDTCASWSKAFALAALHVEEFMFADVDASTGDSRDIKAFRIKYSSGFEVIALASSPRSLRGKQGMVILDEAAFHDDLPELLKAAYALLMWGGKLLVISTHNGVDNPFNELLSEVRAGRRPFAIVRTTFADAMRDGLYKRICLTTGQAWTPEGEAAWEREIRDFYGDAAGEELDCIPRQSGGRFLARTLVEARTADVPVLRWTVENGFVDLPEDERIRRTQSWFDDFVLPCIREIEGNVSCAIGQDFGRSGDLSITWPMTTDATLRRRTPFILEMRNIPFTSQQQMLFAIADALPDFRGAALDARGNGQYLAEVMRQRYGVDFISEVMLSEGWYREHMPPLKSDLEDARLDIPRDKDVVDDLVSLQVVNGVARVVERTKGTTGQRHGDAAIACALALFASRTLDGGTGIVGGGAGGGVSAGAFSGHPELSQRDFSGWLR